VAFNVERWTFDVQRSASGGYRFAGNRIAPVQETKSREEVLSPSRGDRREEGSERTPAACLPRGRLLRELGGLSEPKANGRETFFQPLGTEKRFPHGAAEGAELWSVLMPFMPFMVFPV